MIRQSTIVAMVVMTAQLSLSATQGLSEFQINRAQGELRRAQKETQEDYRVFGRNVPDASPIEELIPTYEKFLRHGAMAQRAGDQNETCTGPSLVWSPPARTVPIPVQSAVDFNCGPGGSVIPFSGELARNVTDIALQDRSGVGFSFERYYASLSSADFGLGIGWDFNWNVTIHEESADGKSLLVLHRLGYDVRFRWQDESWMPEHGHFMRIEETGKGLRLLFPDLSRMDFEPAAESSADGRRWRLSSFASRHGDGTNNRLTVSYLDGCDRIRSITDPYGQTIHFAYDESGHIVQIRAPHDAVQFAYEENGTLASASYPPWLKTLLLTTERETTYEYGDFGGLKLCKESVNGVPYSLAVSYDELGRVAACGLVGEKQEQMWKFTYADGETTVSAPMPTPQMVYRFGAPQHPSLPTEVAMPARGASVKYAYNSDFLVISETDEIGCRSVSEYDSENANPLFRGNCLAVRVTPSSDYESDWQETGTETVYERDIALVSTTVTYQIGKNGTRENVKTESFEYDKKDFTLLEHNDGGIVTRMRCNRYGLPAIEMDVLGNCTIYRYAEKLPGESHYAFESGKSSCGGLLVERIDDADSEQLKTACAELGVRPIPRNDITRCAPVARSTKYAHDVRGNAIREQCDTADSLYFFNCEGNILAESHVGSGTKVCEYLPNGKPEHVNTEFAPSSGNAYTGRSIVQFPDLRFSVETFEYDDLMQLSKDVITEEASIDGVPTRHFDRFPNGRVSRFRNPSGLCREDEVDSRTGYLVGQRMVDDHGNRIVLTEDFDYYPNGELKSFTDACGGRTENILDGFGNIRSVRMSNGRVDSKVVDSLGRVLEETSHDANGRCIARTTYDYDPLNGLPLRETKWLIEETNETPIVVAEYIYDMAGNRIAERGEHKDSWKHVLYDGLGRVVAEKSPSGDFSLKVFDRSLEAYCKTVATGKANGVKSIGTLSEFDSRGRIVRKMPVDAKKQLRAERGETYAYDAVGRCVRLETALLVTTTEYDSQGRVTREQTTPKKTDQGERPTETRSEYFADGRVSLKSIENTALAFVGTKQNARPELADARQATETKYDSFGRVERTRQPDGLILSYEYDGHSLPAKMRWTHEANPTKMLRELEFAYSDMGQVLSVSNSLAKVCLREYEYDLFGRCVKSMDHCAQGEVALLRSYDSIGRLTEDGVSFGNRKFPSRSFRYDPASGETASEWNGGDAQIAGSYWSRESVRCDGAGRTTSMWIGNDSKPFATWNYLGGATETRAIAESGITSRWDFNELCEPVLQMIQGSVEIGRMEYLYGAQGQPEYSSVLVKDSFGQDYTYSIYSEFDSFRRLTAQNGEAAIPSDEEYGKRRDELFGTSEQSLQSLGTGRMAYDEANNLWVKYEGGKSAGFGVNDFKVTMEPQFISSAPVLNSIDSPAAKRELASNREVSQAEYDENGNLKAEEDEYDNLGNLIKYRGTFWNGQRKYPVVWSLEYDPLGRLVGMSATAEETVNLVKKDDRVAELRFAYDAENRRIAKTVIDRTFASMVSTNTTYTLYSGTRQALVFTEESTGISLREEYAWGIGSRELLMAVLPEHIAEKDGGFYPKRYYFQQDCSLNVVLVTKKGLSGVETVSASSYLGFGENATKAKILGFNSSRSGDNTDIASNLSLDDTVEARWYQPSGGLQFLQMNLEGESAVAQLNIWTAEHFPKTFEAYVLPKDCPSPTSQGLDRWRLEHSEQRVAVASNGHYQGNLKLDEWNSPYRLGMGGVKGDRIVIVWDKYKYQYIGVKEFEVLKIPDNPGAIAFAGQWLDRETDLYYQINRYRKAGSEKFISPDPLGFFDGANMYAYAHGNPLEWHDPDGRFAHVLIGAGVGAVLGGGFYALQCWMTGQDFSWKEFAIQTAIGAAVGAISAATFGGGMAIMAHWGFTAGAQVVATATATGAVGGFSNGVLNGLSHGESIRESLKAGGKGAALGAVAGAVSGGVLSKVGGSFGGFALSGSAGGAASGGVDGVWTSLDGGKGVEETLVSGLTGAMKGAAIGGALSSAGWGVGRASGMIKPLKGYPEHLPDPRGKGLLSRTTAYASPDAIPKGLKLFKGALSYRDLRYDGVPGQPGYSIHHIKPVSLGGTTTKGNLVSIPTELHAGPGNMHPGSYVNQQSYGTIFY